MCQAFDEFGDRLDELAAGFLARKKSGGDPLLNKAILDKNEEMIEALDKVRECDQSHERYRNRRREGS